MSDDKIKCVRGLVANMEKHKREIVFDGKPMSEDDFILNSGKLVEERPDMIDPLVFIYKKLYE